MPLNWELITADALSSLGLDNQVDSVSEKECMAYGNALSVLMKDEAMWTQPQLESLRFTGTVLSMILKPDQPSEPYGPMFVFGAERNAIPADFPRAELLGLLDWAMTLRDAELRARFLDVIWVQGKSYAAAQAAVAAYLESGRRLESPVEWPECVKRMERALRLAAGLGKGGAPLRLQVLGEVEAMLMRHRGWPA